MTLLLHSAETSTELHNRIRGIHHKGQTERHVNRLRMPRMRCTLELIVINPWIPASQVSEILSKYLCVL